MFLKFLGLFQKIAFFSISSLFFSVPALAQESSVNSEKSSYGLGAQVGRFVSPVFGLGANFFKKLNPQMDLGARFNSGSADIRDQVNSPSKESRVVLDIARVSATNFGGFFRYYLTDSSFNMVTALEYRRINIELKLSNTLAQFTHSKVTSSSATVSFAISNNWHFASGFFIGADWVGLQVPFYSGYTISTESSVELASEISKSDDESKNTASKLGKSPTLSLLVLNLGMTF